MSFQNKESNWVQKEYAREKKHVQQIKGVGYEIHHNENAMLFKEKKDVKHNAEKKKSMGIISFILGHAVFSTSALIFGWAIFHFLLRQAFIWLRIMWMFPQVAFNIFTMILWGCIFFLLKTKWKEYPRLTGGNTIDKE